MGKKDVSNPDFGIPSWRKDIQHFEGPKEEHGDEFGPRMNNFTQYCNYAFAWVRKNGFPEYYKPTIEYYKNKGVRTNAGPINFEELYALDTAIARTVYQVDVSQMLDLPTSVMPQPRFEMKEYLVQSEETPRFTKYFRNPQFIRLKESSEFANGIGLILGISIPWSEIRTSGGGLWSPRAIMMEELAAKFGIQKSRRVFLGTSCEDAYGDDGQNASGYGITGLFNSATPAVQTFEAGDLTNLDDDVTADTEVNESIWTAMGDFAKVYAPHKKVLITTPGIAAETIMETHRDTYQQRLDAEYIKAKWFDNGKISKWITTNQLYNTTPAVGNQQMMLIGIAPSLVQRKIIYPTQMMPLANKMYEEDIHEVMIFADIVKVKKQDTTTNATPVTVAADVTATTTGGPIGEGLFMLGNYNSPA